VQKRGRNLIPAKATAGHRDVSSVIIIIIIIMKRDINPEKAGSASYNTLKKTTTSS